MKKRREKRESARIFTTLIAKLRREKKTGRTKQS
jgi:hypothetical protein